MTNAITIGLNFRINSLRKQVKFWERYTQCIEDRIDRYKHGEDTRVLIDEIDAIKWEYDALDLVKYNLPTAQECSVCWLYANDTDFRELWKSECESSDFDPVENSKIQSQI